MIPEPRAPKCPTTSTTPATYTRRRLSAAILPSPNSSTTSQSTSTAPSIHLQHPAGIRPPPSAPLSPISSLFLHHSVHLPAYLGLPARRTQSCETSGMSTRRATRPGPSTAVMLESSHRWRRGSRPVPRLDALCGLGGRVRRRMHEVRWLRVSQFESVLGAPCLLRLCRSKVDTLALVV